MSSLSSIGRICALVLVATVLTSGVSRAAGRVALVIGNGAYRFASELPNPPNDAADIARVLRQIGFDVVEGINLDRDAMEDKIRSFGRKLDNAGLALFFYAGHGLQVGGKNYLVPVNAKLERAGDLTFETIDVSQVLAQMESAKRVNLVFLDACRNNPLARSLARSLGTRSAAVGQGLASIQSAIGTMISYATQPDNVALDGTGRNSPFTTALLHHIVTPNLDIGTVMRRVRAEVVKVTREQQVPWDHSSLIGEVVLVRGAAPAQPFALPATTSSPAPTPAVAPPQAPANAAPAAEAEASGSGRAQIQASLPPPARPNRPRAAGERCASVHGPAGTDTYCASSVLDPQFGNRYGAANLFADNTRTAWVEGQPGQGVGEWVVVEFDRERWVESVTLHNGYQKSADIFHKNSRVRTLRLVFSDGHSMTVQLQDRQGAQTIALPRPVRAYWLQFVIDDVYPGNKYTDTAISKLRIASEPVQ